MALVGTLILGLGWFSWTPTLSRTDLRIAIVATNAMQAQEDALAMIFMMAPFGADPA